MNLRSNGRSILTPTEAAAFAADDRLHARPAPLPIPAAMLALLQTRHGDALRLERHAHDLGDTAGEAWAHGLVLRVAAMLWPVGGAA